MTCSGDGAPRGELDAHSNRFASRTQEHAPPRSVAVLPFANLSSDREQEYFSDGLTEELINQLAQVRGLRVLARTSCFALKGKSEDLRVIGQRLRVGCIVEGSVRRAGHRLRITAQLINCNDGYHLWSQTFDRELDDVFAIQNDISRSVANALGIVLGVSNAMPLGGTRNLEAYDLYLRALALTRLFGVGELKRARELYREALALDPEFALAWAGLATVLTYAFTFSPEIRIEGYREREHAVERALAIAPNLWASHAAHASHQAYQRNWSAAERACRKALELAPQSEATAPMALGLLLTNFGRAEEAISLLRSASAVDPLSPAVSLILQFTLTIAGRYEEADTEYRRSQDLSGNREGAEDLALRRAWARGLPAAAIKEQMRRFLAHEVVRMPVQAELLELIDQPTVARPRLREAFDDATYQDPTRQFKISLWAAQFDDIDLALSAARRAYVDLRTGQGGAPLIWLPTYRKVRQDPRFKDLLRDLQIVDYWRATGRWGDFARPVGAEEFEVW